MDIVRLGEFNSSVYSLFCEYAEGEAVYRRLSEEEFTSRFFAPLDGFEKVFLAAFNGNTAVAFAAGCIKLGSDVSYITYVLVAREYRRMGLGNSLLSQLESALKTETTTKFEAVFYNPQCLPWIIPGTPRHDHPGMPGVDVMTPGYIYMKNAGYRDYADTNSYYHRLDNYSFPSNMVEKENAAAALGLGVTYYDKDRHYGVEELMDSLRSDGWRQSVLGNLAKEHPLPLLVAEDASANDGRARVVGFTGPVTVQESGRGYLAGIGVHPDYRGHGLGKLLFSRLCMALKDEGATFMSLFTGETNPARNIYESSGMKIVRCWSCMRKTIK